MERDELHPTAEDLGFRGITSRYAEVENVSINTDNIPPEFRHLLDYASYWGICDETERGDLVWLTPFEELKSFVDTVWPLSSELHQWFDEYSNTVPVPDEVVLYQIMLTVAAEVAAGFVDPETADETETEREAQPERYGDL